MLILNSRETARLPHRNGIIYWPVVFQVIFANDIYSVYRAYPPDGNWYAVEWIPNGVRISPGIRFIAAQRLPLCSTLPDAETTIRQHIIRRLNKHAENTLPNENSVLIYCCSCRTPADYDTQCGRCGYICRAGQPPCKCICTCDKVRHIVRHRVRPLSGALPE